MNHLTAETIRRLMRRHHKTIRGLAASMNISQARVRYVREHGVTGRAFVADWMEATTGNWRAGFDAVARVYL